METRIHCDNPACRQKLVVDESYFGRSFPCPVCGTILQIPSSSQLPPSTKSPAIVMPQMEIPVSIRARIFRLLIGWSVGAVTFILLAWGLQIYGLISRPDLPRHLDEIVREVTLPEGLLNVAPVSNNKETSAALCAGG